MKILKNMFHSVQEEILTDYGKMRVDTKISTDIKVSRKFQIFLL